MEKKYVTGANEWTQKRVISNVYDVCLTQPRLTNSNTI